MKRIRPELDLAGILPLVQMPGRYTGGEFSSIRELGSTLETAQSEFLAAVCFPDLYDIGMSNTAIKLIYTQLNALEGVRCERVFAPAPDFEELLRMAGIPLYTLESGIPLDELDLLGISVGYELSATTILAVLESGQVPILRSDRGDTDPIIIAGGPAITNPAPFSRFFDAVFLGEAENEFSEIVEKLRNLKVRGANRQDRLEILMSFPHIWMPEKKDSRIFRSTWKCFNTPRLGPFPVSNVSVVQDHGVVEIMRGCPNGCRFCHAGMFYRPFRQKSLKSIVEETDYFVFDLGYREITLSSLSTGDYRRLSELVGFLNERYTGLGVSFSLPSLRVNSFTLPLLQEVSKVRKSGLTFAVETADLRSQRGINKEVPVEQVIDILKEARSRGWNMAKFYFMIGLPEHLYDDIDEIDALSEYIHRVRKETGFKLNVNIGTFIPKPHTPYQWSRQLSEEKALEKIRKLREKFHRGPVKISYHSPFVSFLEGMISRGDERVGDLIAKAYHRGARLDAWEEYISYDIWRGVLEETDGVVEEETCRARGLEENLPWDNIDIGVKKSYLRGELEKSESQTLTEECVFPCTHHCGVCVKSLKPEIPQEDESLSLIPPPPAELFRYNSEESEGSWYLFLFEKKGKSRFLSHINIMTIFERSFQRAGMIMEYTKGFNPKPRIDFAHPLSLGIESMEEVARCKVYNIQYDEEFLCSTINKKLPEGIKVKTFRPFPGVQAHGKGKSLMSLFAGADYSITPHQADYAALKTMHERILEFLKEKGFSLDSVCLKDDHINLYVPATGEGKYSLKVLFTELEGGPGPFLSKYGVLRTSLSMIDKTIVDDGEGHVRGSYLRLVL